MASVGAYPPVARMEAKAKEVHAEVALEKQRRKGARGTTSTSQQAERPPSSPTRTISQSIAANSSRMGSISGIAEVANTQRRAASVMSPRRRSMPSREGTTSTGDDDGGGLTEGSPTHGRRRRKTAGGNDAAVTGMTENLRIQLTREVEGLRAELQDSHQRLTDMEQELNTRQESYIRREKRYKDEIAELKAEIQTNSSSERWAKVERAGMDVNGSRREQIMGMHTEILRTLEHFVGKPGEKARTQSEPASQTWLNPKPTPRAAEAQAAAETQEFVDRLREQEIHVKAERQSDNDKQFLVDKIATLRKTLEEQQVANHDLKVEASQAKEEARRIRSQFEYQDDDRESLMRKLHIFKSENERLKTALEAGEAKASSPVSSPQAKPNSKHSRHSKEMDPMAVLSDEVPRARSLEEVIDGLKQLLMQERVRTRKARAAHTAELQQRTTLQAILRQAVDDTRRQRAAVDSVPQSGRTRPQTAPSHRSSSTRSIVNVSAGAGESPVRRQQSVTTLLPEGLSTDDLMDEEGRRMLVDSLMAKEEVMKLLFNRTFPGIDVEPKSKANTVNRIAERAEQEDYLMTAAGQRAQRDAQSRHGASTGAHRGSGVGGGGYRASGAGGNTASHGPRPSIFGGALPVENHGLNVRTSRPWVLGVDTMLSDFMQPLNGGKQNTHQSGAGAHEQQGTRATFSRPF